MTTLLPVPLRPKSKVLVLTALLSALGARAQAAPLSQNLPAGALLTFETHDAGGAIDRLGGLLTATLKGVMQSMGSQQEGAGMLEAVSGIQQILKSSLGKEAVLGVFGVGNPGQPTEPNLLAVSRVDELSGEFFRSMISKKPGAKVGLYTFVRQDGLFVGQAQGLVYVSSNKTLLMNYLARLSGKVAPRLSSSPAYAPTTQAIGQQELSLYVNFSAVASTIRSQLATILLPRLLSPIVDAIDTLGHYAAGFTTTPSGLSAQSAHAANARGKDQPLYRLLTHTTDFEVQNLIPADAEKVAAHACAPESGAYLGRWLTRLDLFDPVGFLTDSQLADHLTQASRYLGDECAQVTLKGGLLAGLDGRDPFKALDYSVSYQKVSDMDAAQAAMPGYASSVNTAIAGLSKTLGELLSSANMEEMDSVTKGLGVSASALGAAAAGVSGSAQQVEALLGRLKLVYAFRDGYLITAYSPKALAAALAENVPTLANDEGFAAAGLDLSAASSWQYAPAPPKLSGQQLMGVFPAELKQADPSLAVTLQPVMNTVAGLFNRYGGMTSQSHLQNNLMLSQSQVLYRWEK